MQLVFDRQSASRGPSAAAEFFCNGSSDVNLAWTVPHALLRLSFLHTQSRDGHPMHSVKSLKETKADFRRKGLCCLNLRPLFDASILVIINYTVDG